MARYSIHRYLLFRFPPASLALSISSQHIQKLFFCLR
jgi:hypothetical protein